MRTMRAVILREMKDTTHQSLALQTRPARAGIGVSARTSSTSCQPVAAFCAIHPERAVRQSCIRGP
jgi:hypothetical protein